MSVFKLFLLRESDFTNLNENFRPLCVLRAPLAPRGRAPPKAVHVWLLLKLD